MLRDAHNLYELRQLLFFLHDAMHHIRMSLANNTRYQRCRSRSTKPVPLRWEHTALHSFSYFSPIALRSPTQIPCRISYCLAGVLYRRDFHKSEKEWAFDVCAFTCSYPWNGLIYFSGRRAAFQHTVAWVPEYLLFFWSISKWKLAHYMCQHVQVNVIQIRKGINHHISGEDVQS